MTDRRHVWGGNIRMVRRMRGLTQAQLAKACDVSRPTVSQWEAGATLPRDDHRDALCGALDAEYAALFPRVK